LNGVLQFVSFNLLNGWQFEQTLEKMKARFLYNWFNQSPQFLSGCAINANTLNDNILVTIFMIHALYFIVITTIIELYN